MDEYPASIDPNIVVQMDEYPPSIEPLGVYKFCGSPPCLFPQSVAVFEGSMDSCNKFCDNNEAVQNPSNNACAAAIRPRAVQVCGLSYFPRLQARMDEINNYAPLPQEEHNYGSASASKGAIREMMFREASLQPVSSMNPDTIRRPRRRNVRISKDPQSVAARHRRERISEKMRILQKLVPGGSKMDTASMLDEAIHYVKFLKRQLQALETEIFWRFSHLK